MRTQIYLIIAALIMAVSHIPSTGSAAQRMVGVIPADGEAHLVKRFNVSAGSTVLGVEFENNDARTVFPKLSLIRGATAALNEGVILATATNVRELATGWIRVFWPEPVKVAQNGEYYVAIMMPAGAEKRGSGDGAAIGADDVARANGSFLAGGVDGALVPVGVDLAMNLLISGVSKATTQKPSEPPFDRAGTFLRPGALDRVKGVVTFELGLEWHSRVTLRIYDVAGRLVRLLVNEELSPGVYQRDWDGHDERGQRVAAGMYIAKAHLGKETITQKIVYTK